LLPRDRAASIAQSYSVSGSCADVVDRHHVAQPVHQRLPLVRSDGERQQCGECGDER
jgi:hypothetical protein